MSAIFGLYNHDSSLMTRETLEVMAQRPVVIRIEDSAVE